MVMSTTGVSNYTQKKEWKRTQFSVLNESLLILRFLTSAVNSLDKNKASTCIKVEKSAIRNTEGPTQLKKLRRAVFLTDLEFG